MSESSPDAPKGHAGAKSAARLAAVQALYEMDVAGAMSGPVLGEFLKDRWSGRVAEEASTEAGAPTEMAAPDSEFLRDLVEGVVARKGEIDEMLTAALTGTWTAERLEVLLRAILRAGVFELLARSDVPARVIISEYVDVAHAFFEDTEPGLVNGVLDTLAKRLRETELTKG